MRSLLASKDAAWRCNFLNEDICIRVLRSESGSVEVVNAVFFFLKRGVPIIKYMWFLRISFGGFSANETKNQGFY